MAVRVLDCQLGLAYPAKAVDRLGLDDRCGCADCQLLGELTEQVVAAGEVEVPWRKIQDRASRLRRAGKGRLRWPLAREYWLLLGLHSALDDASQQRRLGRHTVLADQVDPAPGP